MKLRIVPTIVLVLGLLAVTAAAAQDSAQNLYRDAMARERTLRAQQNPTPSDWLSVIAAYEEVVRRYPASGYSDNALWQAAALARDLSAETGDPRQKERAGKLLRRLVSEYPSSKLVPSAVVEITSLAGAGLSTGAAPVTGSIPIAPTPAAPPASLPALGAARPASVLVRSINRVVLPEVVRVTIELGEEVPLHYERLENPTRVFVDLPGTRTVPSLRDAVLSYTDDVVRQIRVGRHPNATRIVLDVENPAACSFFTLYGPFRLAIDCERTPGPDVKLSGRNPLPADGSTGLLPITQRLPLASEHSAPVLSSLALSRLAKAAAARDGDGTAIAAAAVAPSTNGRGRFSMARQLGLGASRIVIDPGHGGHDPGALNGGLSEAELVLDVALRLEQLLAAQPGFDVVLTRRSDMYLSLEERTAIANREGADLFLSIHANASGNARTRGVETYVLNFAATPTAAAVAARENSGSGRTLSSLSEIVKAITLSSKRDESRDFAATVQRALFRQLKTAGMRDLGVKQAPFIVLIGAEMPSILAEIAFLTNRQDQRLLKDRAYRQRIADALFDGITRYQQALKATNGKLAQQ